MLTSRRVVDDANDSGRLRPAANGGPSRGPDWAMAPPAKTKFIYYPLVIAQAHLVTAGTTKVHLKNTEHNHLVQISTVVLLSPLSLVHCSPPLLEAGLPAGGGGWPVAGGRWAPLPQLLSRPLG